MVKTGELMMILDLHRQGLSNAAIARRTGQDRKTIAKYIARGLEVPAYGPRAARVTILGPFEAYLRERVSAFPEMNGTRLFREIRDRGYTGGYTMVKTFLRAIRPAAPAIFERRFETPPGRQAQVDFAHFKTRFTDAPDIERIVWLFSLVLGHCRFMWARFVEHQDLATVLRCHMAAFEAIGGVPEEILYDRMKTAVLGEVDDRGIVYNSKLLDLAGHYGFLPKACKPYRAKTKGKVERPFRYVREDFFLGRDFANSDDLNRQFRLWLDTVANVRRHATTGRIVAEHFEEEQPHLKLLPSGPYNAVLKLDRRVTRDGMVSVGGNLYSVPDGTTRRIVEVRTLASAVHILDNNKLIASHPILDGSGRRQVAAGHRTASKKGHPPLQSGAIISPRPLAFYDAVARRLAGRGGRP